MSTFPDSYVAYLVEFHATRDYFECHELLEEYWKEHPDDPLADTWIGLIQLAVGLYHERRGNGSGASKMFEQARRRLTLSPLEQLGIEKDGLLAQLNERITSLRTDRQAAYSDINMRIVNAELLLMCNQLCEERGIVWGKASQLSDEFIIHRHTLRDRSDVIAARLEAYTAKKRERNGMS